MDDAVAKVRKLLRQQAAVAGFGSFALRQNHLPTAATAANPRKCRHFSDSRKFLRRDPGGWLGRQDSNLGIAVSKSA